MVRYNNALVEIYSEVKTKNDEGDIIASWKIAETLIGDVQPATLTEEQMKLYGIDIKKGNLKKFFFNGVHESLVSGARAVVTSKLTGTTETYTLQPLNMWPYHGECLLVPVENE